MVPWLRQLHVSEEILPPPQVEMSPNLALHTSRSPGLPISLASGEKLSWMATFVEWQSAAMEAAHNRGLCAPLTLLRTGAEGIYHVS